MTTRHTTPEGFLRAGAVLTRAGPITYLKSELGMEGDGLITIDRTLETISHPQTLASLRGAAITLTHPEDGLNTENAKGLVVGAIAGEPRVTGDAIIADVVIYDQAALDAIDNGTQELSIGYDMMLTPEGRTRGPLLNNHIALVERGRAGSGVRIMDSAEERMNAEDAKVLADAVAAALDRGNHNRQMDTGAMDAFKKEMMDTITPIVDGMKEMKASQDAAVTAADNAKATADAKAAGDALVNATRVEERERFAVLTDAMPLIAEDKRAALLESDPKAILVAALGDSIPNADTMSVDYLRGALSFAKVQQAAAANDGLPAGVKAFDSARPVTATDARAKAQADYEAMITKRYADSGGI